MTSPTVGTAEHPFNIDVVQQMGQEGLVIATTNPVTGGIGFNGQIVDMDETPDETNTAAYPVGTLFISPAE